MNIDSVSLGQQLRCPSGTDAPKIGEIMFESNCNMIFKTIDILNIEPNTSTFEIGFGNGKHLPHLFNKKKALTYHGLEISLAMIKEATSNNKALVSNGEVQFKHMYDDKALKEININFDYCFSVNTLYFWKNPQFYFNEIYRVLKLGGKIAITFIPKYFGEQLAFTQNEFLFYESDEVESFLCTSGFSDIESIKLTENAISKDGQNIIRPFIITTALKLQN